MEEASARRDARSASEQESESGPDYRIRESYLFRQYEAWREESEPSEAAPTASGVAGGSTVSTKQGAAAEEGPVSTSAPPSTHTEGAVSKGIESSLALGMPETPDECETPPACSISNSCSRGRWALTFPCCEDVTSFQVVQIETAMSVYRVQRLNLRWQGLFLSSVVFILHWHADWFACSSVVC